MESCLQPGPSLFAEQVTTNTLEDTSGPVGGDEDVGMAYASQPMLGAFGHYRIWDQDKITWHWCVTGT